MAAVTPGVYVSNNNTCTLPQVPSYLTTMLHEQSEMLYVIRKYTSSISTKAVEVECDMYTKYSTFIDLTPVTFTLKSFNLYADINLCFYTVSLQAKHRIESAKTFFTVSRFNEFTNSLIKQIQALYGCQIQIIESINAYISLISSSSGYKLPNPTTFDFNGMLLNRNGQIDAAKSLMSKLNQTFEILQQDLKNLKNTQLKI